MQERVLSVLREDGSELLTRARYEEITGVSRSQAAYDLAELVEAGILVRLGGGRATRYRLDAPARPARPSTPSHAEPRGKRRWTNERIRTELERFCAKRKTWPSPAEFKAAGHSDLYVAASRYGGVGFWASELGFTRPGRTAPPTRSPLRPRLSFRRPRWTFGPPRWSLGLPSLSAGLPRPSFGLPRPSFGPRVRWGASAAIGAAALLAVGGASINSLHGVQRLRSSLSLEALGPTFVPKRDIEIAASTRPSKPHVVRKVHRAQAKSRRVTHVRQAPAPAAPTVHTSAPRTDLAAVRTPAPTYTPASEPQSTSQPVSHSASGQTQPTSSSSSRPAPLPPPPGGGGAPQPIPPPHR